MKVSRADEMRERSNGAKAVAFTDIAVFFTVCWIVLALMLGLLFKMHWFTQGDFSYSQAMYYHGVMIPVLILLYLLTTKILALNLANGRAYSGSAILSILFVGLGSIFNTSKGISVTTVSQVIGMVMTDCIGIVLVVAMVKWGLEEHAGGKGTGAAFWLLLTSLTAILISSPLGHLAGWFIDIGPRSIPGLNALLNVTGIEPNDFQDSLVASHSHLIVAALMTGLAAVAAIYLEYRSRARWKRRVSGIGLWMMLICILSATGIYVFSAIIGWEPPVLFASGPNGIPLDDVVLTALEIGLLIMMVGISGSLESPGTNPFSSLKATIRIGIFSNWIFGFMGAVILGIYIELHEGFYGGGEAPAPGAVNDNIFIRAHMLYAFFLLPIILAVILVVGCKYNRTMAPRSLPFIFVWTSIFGMLSGLVGEIVWFTTGGNQAFVFSVFVMVMALIVGMISLWPNAGLKESDISV